MFYKLKKLYNIYYMTQLYEINVKLSDNQKKNLSNAYHKRETIVLRLTKDSLSGNDTLYVPLNIVKRLENNQKLRKGMDIKLSKTNIQKQVGGSLLSTVLSLGKPFAPTIAKTLGLSVLAGLASEGASQVVKKISGKGIQKGGFLIPQNKIDQLITYKHLLTAKQKKDILNALQTGSGVHIKPTKVQTGGFLGTLLASIGIPLVLDTLKSLTGSGAPQMGLPKRRAPRSIPTKSQTVNQNQNGGLVLPYDYRSPPLIGSWPDKTIGLGTKKTKKQNKKKAPQKKISKKGEALLLGKNSPFKNVPLLNILL